LNGVRGAEWARGGDHVTECNTVGKFVEAGLGDVTAHAEELRARGVGGAQRAPPRSAVPDDRSNRNERFDVIDDRGVPQVSLRHRVRGADSGATRFSFQRFDQRRLFTADVRAGAERDFEGDALSLRHRRLGGGDALARRL